ncbi:MAG: hypothetical protein QNJ78_08120 [Gammaproteobacteria bacterium]|nr:hypothetical protein [Gammaproteobacteria bacterium]
MCLLSGILLTTVDSLAGMSSSMKQAIEQAKQALSLHAKVPAGQIKVQGAEAVEWRDGSLGCPEKGKVYTQALQPGFRIKLRISDRVYHVHTAGTQAKICRTEPDKPHTRIQSQKTETIDLLRRARRDLSRRIDVPETQIRVKSIMRIAWREIKKACAAEDIADGTQGYRLDLLADDQQHRYFGVAGGRLIYCQSVAE